MSKEIKLTNYINGNTLDNRRSNLRNCTVQQNSANRPKTSNNTSGAKGVTFHKKSGKWMAQIRWHNKTYYLGLFVNVEDAAKAYQEEAKLLFEDFARSE